MQEAANEREEKRDYLGAKRSKEIFRGIVLKSKQRWGWGRGR